MLDLKTVKNTKRADQAAVDDAGDAALSGCFVVIVVALGLMARIMERYDTRTRATQSPGSR
jgi:hypothetical protein